MASRAPARRGTPEDAVSKTPRAPVTGPPGSETADVTAPAGRQREPGTIRQGRPGSHSGPLRPGGLPGLAWLLIAGPATGLES